MECFVAPPGLALVGFLLYQLAQLALVLGLAGDRRNELKQFAVLTRFGFCLSFGRLKTLQFCRSAV